jgi:hypothetical protein
VINRLVGSMSRESSIADTGQIKESIGKIAFAVTYLGPGRRFPITPERETKLLAHIAREHPLAALEKSNQVAKEI